MGLLPGGAHRPGRIYLAGAPILTAHRGGARLAPENTMLAFERALAWWGADMLEMDVRATRDGEVVVIHDETVDRTTDGTGAVRDHTWTELSRLDAGFRFRDARGGTPFRGLGIRVPRFEDVLTALPGVRVNVEAKEVGVAAGLAEIVRRHGAEERVLLAAEYERSRRDARGYRGPWGASRHHVFLFWTLHRLPLGGPYTPAADALQVPETHRGRRIVTPRFVREAHRRNLPVHVWTVDDPSDMRRLLDWGVDGIQTDRPDLLAEVLTERTGRPPPPGPPEGGV